jgi:hypothetical protein
LFVEGVFSGEGTVIEDTIIRQDFQTRNVREIDRRNNGPTGFEGLSGCSVVDAAVCPEKQVGRIEERSDAAPAVG